MDSKSPGGKFSPHKLIVSYFDFLALNESIRRICAFRAWLTVDTGKLVIHFVIQLPIHFKLFRIIPRIGTYSQHLGKGLVNWGLVCAR